VSRRLVQIMGAVTGGPAASRSIPEKTSAGSAAQTPASALPTAGAFDPGRPGLRVVAVVAAIAVLGAAAFAWQARPHPVPVAPAAGASPAVGSRPSAAIVVAVAGKVRFPGLVRLSADARVADAIEAAGGVLPGTDLSTVNLARKVTDGELITIGIPTAAGGPAGGPSAAGRLNLNTATASQLDALPGVGPVLAERIVAYRDKKGAFRSVGELRQVDGIGDAKFEQLKDLVTV
jgi:competence protein ComEA